MKILLLVIKKRTSQASGLSEMDLHALMKEAAQEAFPVRNFDIETNSQKWSSPQGNIVAQIISNEANEPAFLPVGKDAIAFKIGHSDKDATYLFKNGIIHPELAINSGGCFSFGCIDPNGADLITDAAGSHPFYFCEDELYYIITSKSKLSFIIKNKLLAKQQKKSTGLNIYACRDLALQGHYLGQSTAFEGVESSKVHEHIRVSEWSLKRESWLTISKKIKPLMASDYQALVDELATALITSVDNLNGSELHLSITGGRDSRLLAAILRNCSNIKVRTATSGFPEHPDVVLGKLISERLGWQHETKAPKTKNSIILVESPLERALRTLDVHDCSTSAWDECPDYGSYSQKPTMSGVGGEILRGGMTLISKDSIDNIQAKQILTSTLCGGGFFNSDIQASAEEKARALLMLCEKDPHAALDNYYHQHRNHRWVCNRRNGARLRWNIIDPLLDNKVLCLALSVDAKTRWSEQLVFDVIDKLSPSLVDIPIEGERWRFERTQASEHSSNRIKDTWGNRSALRPTPASNNRDWRKLEDPQYKNLFMKNLNEQMSKDSLKLFNEEKLFKYLETSSYPTTIWHIFTTIVLLNNKDKSSRNSKTDSIEVCIS